MSKIVYQDYKYEKLVEVVAFTTDPQYINSTTFCDLPLISTEDIQNVFPPNEYDMSIILSYTNTRYRKQTYNTAKSKKYNLINYISPRATLLSEIQGDNNIIMGGVYMGPFGSMGSNNIIRHNVYIGHNYSINSHNYIAPSCNIGGYVSMGELCFLGIGSTVKERIKISDETLLGAGAVLLKDTEPYSVYVGNPARKIKEHKETGIIT